MDIRLYSFIALVFVAGVFCGGAYVDWRNHR